MQKQKTALVTGGAGFIGSNFVRYFLTTYPTYHIVVLDNLTYAGNFQNLTDLHTNPRLTFIQGDICDRPTVEAAMQGCAWVIHFAAETHVDRSILSPNAFIQTDIIGTYTLLEVARDAGIERFIQISTDEVYGNAEAPDGRSRPSIETDTLKPLSPYAASKCGAERLVFSYHATYGLPIVITRCSNNYGPYQYPEKQLPLFITNALANRPLPIYGDGKNTRDWIHVSDHCRALDLLLHASLSTVNGEVFNIGSSAERSVLENAIYILQFLKKPRDLIRFIADRPGHVHRHAVDARKLQERLGWVPLISFQEGLEQTISWYSMHEDWLSDLLKRHDTFLEQALVAAQSPTSLSENRK